jgi:sporulation protein YlmC with PRC-barrel domain
MIKFRIGARVDAKDRWLGYLVALVADPVAGRVTHLVVDNAGIPDSGQLVPVEKVIEADDDHLHLDITAEEFFHLEPFVQPLYLRGDDYHLPGHEDTPEQLFLFPFTVPAKGWTFVFEERVPPGEVAIRRGAEVLDAKGSRLGQVDEFLVDPSDHRISHLVLRRGHIFGSRTITIPMTEIVEALPDRVRLRLTNDEVERLEDVPVEPPFGPPAAPTGQTHTEPRQGATHGTFG